MKKQSKSQKWIDYLEEQLNEEKEKVAGYEQLAKVHSAYIAILLKKLGATEDKKITITAPEVKNTIAKCEVRAEMTDNGYNLYFSE